MDTFNEYVCLMEIIFPIRRVWGIFYHVCALISPTAMIALSWLGFSLIWKEVCKQYQHYDCALYTWMILKFLHISECCLLQGLAEVKKSRT